MRGGPLSAKLLCAVGLLAVLSPTPVPAANKDKSTAGTKVTGIVIDKRDNWLTVRADGDEQPAKYVFDPSDKKLAKALKHVYNVNRVQLTYTMDGDTRRLVGIQRRLAKTRGTVTGVVVHVHEVWVEVKPKNGPPDGYCANYPVEKWKKTLAALKELHKGDVVVIRYTTDSERHRIETIRKIKSAKKPDE